MPRAALIFVFCVVVTAFASPAFDQLSAGCDYCAWDPEMGSACLVGCPVGDIECTGIEDCQEINGGCRGSSFCQVMQAAALSDGTVTYVDELDTPVAERAALFTEDGASRYRRTCDSAIVARSYEEVKIAEYLNSSKTLVL